LGADKVPDNVGKGPVYGTMAVHYVTSDIDAKAVLITDPGSFYTTFAGLKKVAPFHDDGARLDLLARLNAIPGIHLPYEAIHKWWPGFRLRDLSLPGGAQQVLDTLDWTMDRIEEALNKGSV
jgi:hypothetical protein